MLVHLARDPHALDVRVRRPRISTVLPLVLDSDHDTDDLGDAVTIGEPPDMLLTLTSGRNDIARVTIKLSSPTGVALHCRNARFEDADNALPLETTDDSLTLVDVPKETVHNILVPHAEAAKHPVVVRPVAVYTAAYELIGF